MAIAPPPLLCKPFLGTEALSSGLVATKHRLRTRYRRIFPGVYLPAGANATLPLRTEAAVLWSRGLGVVAGRAAAALHGARWVDDEVPVDLVLDRTSPPPGIVCHRDALGRDEVTVIGGLRVTTVARTAFDLARHLVGRDAVAVLDALGWAADLVVDDVRALMDRHPGARGVRRVAGVLDRHDPGAQSPRETKLRLLLTDNGFPRPATQIAVRDRLGRSVYYLDMGWEDRRIAVEYDGDHHRDRSQFGWDLRRSEYLAGRGWTLVRVIAGDRDADVIARVRAAWASSVGPDRRSPSKFDQDRR